MEMVQKQRLHLKMKFLMGNNMKMFVLWGNKNLVVTIFPGGEILFTACADDGISVKQIFAIKAPKRRKFLGVCFHNF